MTEKRFMKIFLCLASLCTAPLLLGPAMLRPAGRAAPAAQRAAVQRAAPATQETARALGGGEASAPWPEGVLQLRQQAVCGADGLYTVTLEAWAAGPLPEGDWPGGEAVLAYTLTDGLAFGPDTAVHAYAIDKTRSGWAAVKQECPDLRIAADAQAGTLRVSGFDYTARARDRKTGAGRQRPHDLRRQARCAAERPARRLCRHVRRPGAAGGRRGRLHGRPGRRRGRRARRCRPRPWMCRCAAPTPRPTSVCSRGRRSTSAT